jgi:hypothetical protein
VKPIRRHLAGVAALLTVALVASGCDSSPYAASVDGHVIKQTALNAELRQLAGNPYYVQLAAQGTISKPAITVTGASNGSYNAAWTAEVLSDIVVGEVVGQHLASTHEQPSAAQYAATRAVDGILYDAHTWGRFSPAFRSTLVQRDADLAMVEPNGLTAANLKTVLADYPTQLFSDVCVRTVAVTVTGSAGVDYPASLKKADALASAFDASPASVTGGSVTCYTAAQLESQAYSFVQTILGIRTHQAGAPEKTVYGYRVVGVTSRATIPADKALALAFTVAINEVNGQTAKVVGALLAKARVKVNPLYGAWHGSATVPFAVVAPAAPGSSN